MDIRYKDNKIEVAITNIDKEAIHSKEEMNSIIEIINLLKSFDISGIKQIAEVKKDKEKLPIVPDTVKQKKSDDRPVVRDRLPNTVDMSEIELLNAVTEEPMVRCPGCGQTSVVIVNISDTQNYLLRKITDKNNKETFETVLELATEDDIKNICKPKEANALDYHNDIVKIKSSKKLKNTNMNVSNETNVLCPLCGHTHIFKDWVEAFKHPLDYGFETELLCDICGSEAVSTIDENKNEVIVCESCGSKKIAVK